MVPPYGVSGPIMSSQLTLCDGRQPVLVIAGPTASGKSGLALRLAEAFDGVVINADSMQVYRELRILTARPSAEAEARAPHRLYGVIPAVDPCSLARWRAMALAEIAEVGRAGKLAILCGGTGMYLKGLMQGISEIPEIATETRAAARALQAEIGGAALRARLAEEDPETAARLHDGDTQRLIRAWEVVRGTGRALSDWTREPDQAPEDLRFFSTLLMPPRAELYAACDARLVEMIAGGGLEEVWDVMDQGIDASLPAMQALGVPQLASQLHGDSTPEAALALAQQETRRYAKRQMTWFRNQLLPNMTLNEKLSESLLAEIFIKIRQFLLT
jgi:tRNA dimethylallyltransferase